MELTTKLKILDYMEQCNNAMITDIPYLMKSIKNGTEPSWLKRDLQVYARIMRDEEK